MNSPTPLQVLLSLLTGSPCEELPASASEIRDLLRRQRLTPRQREVVEYLVAASDGRLGRRGAGGSLKHVLWWLRDNAGELYVPAARDTLRLAMEGDWPLTNVLPHLRGGSVVGQFVDAIGQATHARALLADVREVSVGPWRVAVYEGTRNLLKPVMQAGFDVYVALSERGGVVKTRRGLAVAGEGFPGWKQVYPDLLILNNEHEWRGGVEEILRRLPQAVHRRA